MSLLCLWKRLYPDRALSPCPRCGYRSEDPGPRSSPVIGSRAEICGCRAGRPDKPPARDEVIRFGRPVALRSDGKAAKPHSVPSPQAHRNSRAAAVAPEAAQDTRSGTHREAASAPEGCRTPPRLLRTRERLLRTREPVRRPRRNTRLTRRTTRQPRAMLSYGLPRTRTASDTRSPNLKHHANQPTIHRKRTHRPESGFRCPATCYGSRRAMSNKRCGTMASRGLDT